MEGSEKDVHEISGVSGMLGCDPSLAGQFDDSALARRLRPLKSPRHVLIVPYRGPQLHSGVHSRLPQNNNLFSEHIVLWSDIQSERDSSHCP
jgi:hypothetical protein